MPVACYSTLMAVTCAKYVKQAGLDGHMILTKRLEQVATEG